jgi:hypothetical protein
MNNAFANAVGERGGLTMDHAYANMTAGEVTGR